MIQKRKLISILSACLGVPRQDTEALFPIYERIPPAHAVLLLPYNPSNFDKLEGSNLSKCNIWTVMNCFLMLIIFSSFSTSQVQ